jgi:cysteine-rich repeat protein
MAITKLLAGSIMAFVAACGAAGRPDPQTVSCGDGVTASPEQCDDGNAANGDGCSSTCQTEGPDPQAVCGDGIVAPSEACDDGNAVAGDGCAADCTMEQEPQDPEGTCGAPFQVSLVDNAGVLEGTGTGDTTGGQDQVAEASCDGFPSGAGFDQVWSFTIPDTRDVVVEINGDTTTFDSVLRLMSTACDVSSEVVEYGLEDGCTDFAGAGEFLGYVRLPAGTYYVVIDGYTAEDFGAYAFSITASATACGNGTLDFLEFCDDGNGASSDGCDDKCEFEEGFTCNEEEPTVCIEDGGEPSELAPGDLVLNEFMAGDNSSDTNCDGSTASNSDEFVELVNVSTKTVDLEGVTISDSLGLRHTFAATTLAPGEVVVVWGSGAPACAGVTSFAVASSGQLGLNDDGDSIVVKLADETVLLDVQYPAVTLNVSSNLSPDLTGTSYVQHSSMAATAFSPGKRSTGAPF